MLEGVWEPNVAPFIHVRRVGSQVSYTGTPHARLGHRIALPDGSDGGNWAEWHWDGDRLLVATDRFRGYPVFYAADPDGVAVSPSIDALLALGIDRRLDLDAIAVFLTLGYYLGTDTPFAAIRLMPAGVGFAWASGALTIEAGAPPRPALSLSREQAIEGAADLARQAVRRCIPDDDAYDLPLSGGRDSRHLLLELIDAGHPPRSCVTAHHHPIVRGGDVPYAARLAAEFGLPHRVVTPGPFVAEEWAKNRVTGYRADEHAWYRSVAEALNGYTSHTYDGLNGSSAMSRHYYPTKLRRLDAEKRLDELAAYVGKKLDGQPRFVPLVAPGLRGGLSAERAAARIRTELEVHVDAPEPFLACRFWGHTMGELNLTSTLMLHGVPRAYTPFLDPDFVAHLLAVPSEHVDERFHDDIIALRFPRGNDVPYIEKPAPQPSRTFLRRTSRDLLALLRSQSDGSLVDRRSLIRRAAVGAAVGDAWFAWGRRAALTTYLVQLESIVAGRGPADLV